MLTYRDRLNGGRSMVSRPVIAAAAGCAVLALAAGCGNGGDTTSANSGGNETASTPASPAPPFAPSSAPASGTQDHAASASASACGTATLKARLTLGGAAAGNRFAALVLTNTGSAPCHTYGYVGLKLTGGGNPPTKVVRSTEVGKPHRIVLKPGKSAWSRLHWGNVPGPGDQQSGDCRPTATGLWVTPPDQRDHLTVKWSLGPVCEGGTINLNPLRRGDHDPRAA